MFETITFNARIIWLIKHTFLRRLYIKVLINFLEPRMHILMKAYLRIFLLLF